MTKQMTGARMVIQALKDQGVEVVFGYPGGAVLPIYDEIFQQNDIRHVLVRHEQGAVHMAEGYARSTGKPGVALVTSGPGATNAVTGLTDALMDSIPIVVLTGQVPTFMIGTDGFQEADTVGITRPCTKMNWLVKDTAKLADTIHQAFHVATHGRPGPVLVDIPKDVQFATADYVPAEKARVTHYQPRTEGRPRPHRATGRADGAGRAPGASIPAAAWSTPAPAPAQLLREVTAETNFPDHLHPDGAGVLPGLGQELAGHAGDARAL
jgi:acetolactate synthase-1/2/3 large subunit